MYVNNQSIEFAELKQKVSAHHVEAEYWKKMIEGVRNDVIRLQTDPKARPGSFTADDGKDLRNRITGVERNAENHIHDHEKRLDALEQAIKKP